MLLHDVRDCEEKTGRSLRDCQYFMALRSQEKLYLLPGGHGVDSVLNSSLLIKADFQPLFIIIYYQIPL